jgi:CSLREA domain-containing protein
MKNLLLLTLLIAALLSAQPFRSASAGTLTVNALDDTIDGSCDTTHCSLREAILYATSGDTIDFSVTGTIMLNGTQLTIDKSLTLTGPGEDLLTISANTASPSKASQVFYIHSSASNLDVAITGLSIANGHPGNGFGGGLYNDGENLTLTNCLISDHTAKDGGGGIYNSGTLTISYSTFSDNTSTGGPGGGIYNDGTLHVNSSTILGNAAVSGAGGGLYNTGVATVDNSTIFDNHADSNRYWGGGIGNYGTLSVNRSTISANSADLTGAGLRHKGDSLTLSNTIIANNIGSGDCQSDTSIIDGGYNLIEGTDGDACDLVNGVNGNITGLDPLLDDVLGDYGGLTLTLPILFLGSPAWDAIPNGVNGCVAGVSLDQRGEVRGGGTSSTGYATCDIGAFEYGSGEGPILNQIFLPLIINAH